MSALTSATASSSPLPPAGMDAPRSLSNGAFKPEHAGSGQVGTAPFISPVTRVDAATGVAVQMYRDGDTGEVELQYPSQATVKAYSAPVAEAGRAPVDLKPAMTMPQQQQAPAIEHQVLVA